MPARAEVVSNDAHWARGDGRSISQSTGDAEQAEARQDETKQLAAPYASIMFIVHEVLVLRASTVRGAIWSWRMSTGLRIYGGMRSRCHLHLLVSGQAGSRMQRDDPQPHDLQRQVFQPLAHVAKRTHLLCPQQPRECPAGRCGLVKHHTTPLSRTGLCQLIAPPGLLVQS